MEQKVLLIFSIITVTLVQSTLAAKDLPPYVRQCYENDPKIIDCFIKSLYHLRPYLANGIPEIEVPTVEPFQLDELSLSLTTGPNGYKITLKEMDIYGASNFTINKLKLSENGKPFETLIQIPQLKINAHYSSSGVLIILPASGNGTFKATFDDVRALIKGQISTSVRDGQTYMHVEELKMELGIKNAKMGVYKIFKNNQILTQAINLFLRENGDEVLKAMMPQLREKLASIFKDIFNKLLKHIPIELIIVSTPNNA